MKRIQPLPTYFDTLSCSIRCVETHLADREITLADPDSIRDAFNFGGVSYGETKQAHAEIATIKDKPTKKYAHVTVYRMDSGTYEVTFYIL